MSRCFASSAGAGRPARSLCIPETTDDTTVAMSHQTAYIRSSVGRTRRIAITDAAAVVVSHQTADIGGAYSTGYTTGVVGIADIAAVV